MSQRSEQKRILNNSDVKGTLLRVAGILVMLGFIMNKCTHKHIVFSTVHHSIKHAYSNHDQNSLLTNAFMTTERDN